MHLKNSEILEEGMPEISRWLVDSVGSQDCLGKGSYSVGEASWLSYPISCLNGSLDKSVPRFALKPDNYIRGIDKTTEGFPLHNCIRASYKTLHETTLPTNFIYRYLIV